MEKLSKCCGVKRKIIDNWDQGETAGCARFTYVCSSCEKDFKEIDDNICPTCHADLPPNHPLRG